MEAQQSSTWRELHAVRLVLESLIAKLNNCTIRWFTDNQNVVYACILQVGSKTPLLQKEALSVFSLSAAHNISIEPEWIPHGENQLADYISHIQDWDDWQLNPSVFYTFRSNGVHVQSTTLLAITTLSCHSLIATIITQGQRQLIHLLVTGALR